MPHHRCTPSGDRDFADEGRFVASLFISIGPDDYVMIGRSMNIYFESARDSSHLVWLGTVEDGNYVGDTYTIQRVKLYRYQ